MPHNPSKRYLYNAWQQMVRRCHDPNNPYFKDYGKRGIAVCEEWRISFDTFLRDMPPRPSPKHSIDRIDNNQGYKPGNVRWATMKEQSNNRRNNRLVTYLGRTQTAVHWAEEIFPENPGRIQTRLAKGWSVEKALATKIREKAKTVLDDILRWNGEEKTVREWGEQLFPGDRKIIPMRLDAGWTVERALTQRKRGRH